MRVSELVEKLLKLEAEGKGDYDVVASTQDGGLYDVDRFDEGAGWIEFN